MKRKLFALVAVALLLPATIVFAGEEEGAGGVQPLTPLLPQPLEGSLELYLYGPDPISFDLEEDAGGGGQMSCSMAGIPMTLRFYWSLIEVASVTETGEIKLETEEAVDSVFLSFSTSSLEGLLRCSWHFYAEPQGTIYLPIILKNF